jgi:acyl-CoA synthetase (AMP-forming)/AMP-acid ligase II
MPKAVNIGARLTASARAWPERLAIVQPLARDAAGRRQYRTTTFRELDEASDRVARGLVGWGVPKGARLALLVPPSIEFVTLAFGLFKAAVTTILIDPGMGRRNLLGCLADAAPEGFVAISPVHAARVFWRRRFSLAKWNVTVGRRWFWGGRTLDEIVSHAATEGPLPTTQADDPAAIIFTTGSTGPPKGVLYRHGNFDRQVDEIRDRYDILPGAVDLACFPLFGLFDAAMGVTTVIPDMNASRPASVDPAKIVEAVLDRGITQAFASPAVWNVVGPYCVERSIVLPTLRRVLSAGAPVPPRVLESMRRCLPEDAEIHTPYGATEALPVASISSREVLGETQFHTRQGEGTCVGSRFPGIEWKVIRPVRGPIASIDQVVEANRGETGELIVRGPVVTAEYVTRREANPLAKIAQGDTIWHRLGDVGYLDERERFWYCGRLAHRVETEAGPLDTDPCEAIYNEHSHVFRSALVGVGPLGTQRPIVLCEPWKMPASKADRDALVAELLALGEANPRTSGIADVWLHPGFPVDIRHNAKISRETLAVWAAKRLSRRR